MQRRRASTTKNPPRRYLESEKSKKPGNTITICSLLVSTANHMHTARSPCPVLAPDEDNACTWLRPGLQSGACRMLHSMWPCMVIESREYMLPDVRKSLARNPRNTASFGHVHCTPDSHLQHTTICAELKQATLTWPCQKHPLPLSACRK